MSPNRKTSRIHAAGDSSTSSTHRRAHAWPGNYLRDRDLPRLIALWPSELETVTNADHLRLLARLRSALRVERQRGLAGHWAYDLTRHAQLLKAYRAETARCLDAMSKFGGERADRS